MIKRILLLLAIVLITAGCAVDAGEELMESNFSQPRSDYISVEVEEGLRSIEFIIEAEFTQGSTTVYIHDPHGEVHILGLGMTDSDNSLAFDDPTPGQWQLEVHVDGNSETVVDGELRLNLKRDFLT